MLSWLKSFKATTSPLLVQRFRAVLYAAYLSQLIFTLHRICHHLCCKGIQGGIIFHLPQLWKVEKTGLAHCLLHSGIQDYPIHPLIHACIRPHSHLSVFHPTIQPSSHLSLNLHLSKRADNRGKSWTQRRGLLSEQPFLLRVMPLCKLLKLKSKTGGKVCRNFRGQAEVLSMVEGPQCKAKPRLVTL